MVIFKLVIALLIVAGVLYALYRLQKEFQGGASTLSASKTRSKDSGVNGPNELEAFIAAYRRDKAAVVTPAEAVVTSWSARKSYLTPHIKLCYLVLKAGLPDHHVFCNARLLDALELHSEHPLANVRIDIVVCNKELAPIAAIDISNQGERGGLPEREKVERLQSAGMRYLRFTPGAIPKPAEIRDLIYRA